MRPKGIPISPRLHKIRLILLIMVTPLITWYAKQRYTNPVQPHREIAIGTTTEEEYLLFYEATTFTKTPYLHLFFSPPSEKAIPSTPYIYPSCQDSLVHVSDDTTITTTIVHTSHGQFSLSKDILFIRRDDLNTAVMLRPSQGLSRRIETDILLLTAPTSRENLMNIRSTLTPRLTIRSVSDTFSDILPKNIQGLHKNTTYRIHHRPRGSITLTPME
ncbi:hypothetical protein [Chitinivibrio alkaliphilus]|uniref:Uncharacterized protein n=1 Tax=Chitinivibrio alkaliphilus ACht1 TaxID=1313304 RepID=U7DCI9_9BACT|nr:hypothetical protein [Chitinivibrio alkaliphilus]ERP32150.1 hypothetical protein CALK_0879 [Chitinivibrio alkaliphilus ACht1]